MKKKPKPIPVKKKDFSAAQATLLRKVLKKS